MKNKISAFIVISIIIVFGCFLAKGYMIKNDIEKNGKITIGKFVLQDNYNKGQTNFFIFYIDGNQYKENGGRAPKGFSENIGKFYKIIYSEKYKGHIQALFNEQVTDTVAILKAGFSREDIERKISNY